MKENPIKDCNDINDLAKELIAQVVENSLEGELDMVNVSIKLSRYNI